MAYSYGGEPDPQDVSNLADMIPGIVGLDADDVPREVLEGLAAELVRSYGDDTTDAFALIDSWLGDYME